MAYPKATVKLLATTVFIPVPNTVPKPGINFNRFPVSVFATNLPA